jgi:hypothetical protein
MPKSAYQRKMQNVYGFPHWRPTVPNNAVNPDSFGRSVERKAQLFDARKTVSATDDESLNIYRLSPIAHPEDGRWSNAPSNGDVMVAARRSGHARVVAAGCETDFMKRNGACGPRTLLR